jgi:adenine-specific DNA-methyltransferase
MPDNYDNLSREQLIGLLRKRDLARRLGLVWERDEIEHERLLSDEIPLAELDERLSRGAGPWRDLLIEGDNFPALRFLRAAFKGRVKCIYIDPPYNTGNRDFVYNDRYLDSDNAFRHSTWLEFLYRRLTLARDLLREDGVFLVSINDENRAYLELLLSQIWPGGRKGTLVWRSRIGDNSGKGANLSVNHEHILVWAGEGFAFRGSERTFAMYGNPDNDSRGDWASDNLVKAASWKERPNAFYPIFNPDTQIWYAPNPDQVWRFASETKLEDGDVTRKETMEELIRQKRILFPKDARFGIWETLDDLKKAIREGEVPMDGTGGLLIREGIPLIDLSFWVGKKIGFGAPRYKRFKSELKDTNQPLSSWVKSAAEKDFKPDEDSAHIESGFTDEGSKELRRLLGDKAFPYPKPPSLLRGLVDQSTGPGDIVLDFFAGSATTAQAVAELNARDEDAAREAGESSPARRRWIMVSSTEATEDEPDKNICRDVAARRLAALGLEHAYLRMRSAPAAFDGRGIEESWLEPSLQLLLASCVGVKGEGKKLSWLEGEDSVVAFVPELTKALLEELEAYEPPEGKTALVASFQPGPLKQRLGQRPDMRVVALPDSLVKSLASTGGKP